MNAISMALLFGGFFVAYVLTRGIFRTCPSTEHRDVGAQLKIIRKKKSTKAVSTVPKVPKPGFCTED